MAQQVYEMTLNDFIEIAASKSHTPGGGTSRRWWPPWAPPWWPWWAT